MGVLQITATGSGIVIDPRPLVFAEDAGGEEAKESFSIDASGTAQLTGLSYTVPAHTSGTIKAQLQTSALTSQDVADLNAMATGFLEASVKEEVREQEKTSGSANVTVWSWLFGRGSASASFERIHETMLSKGLTEAQISELMDAFLERATNMSRVQIDFFVNNELNDYSVSGDLYLYTVAGTVKTTKGTAQYRMLADNAAAGGPPASGGGAPATGKTMTLR